jgi:hypothetical protein
VGSVTDSMRLTSKKGRGRGHGPCISPQQAVKRHDVSWTNKTKKGQPVLGANTASALDATCPYTA